MVDPDGRPAVKLHCPCQVIIRCRDGTQRNVAMRTLDRDPLVSVSWGKDRGSVPKFWFPVTLSFLSLEAQISLLTSTLLQEF